MKPKEESSVSAAPNLAHISISEPERFQTPARGTSLLLPQESPQFAHISSIGGLPVGTAVPSPPHIIEDGYLPLIDGAITTIPADSDESDAFRSQALSQEYPDLVASPAVMAEGPIVPNAHP
ncbi:hypothetical protein C0991_006987, partial [Blastosporella zonata]